MTPGTMTTLLYNVNINNQRRQGLSDEEIATAMSLPISSIRAVTLPKPQPARQRAAQAMQLATAIQQLMPKVEAGDLDAIQVMLKVQKREADLLGLDAPKEVVSHNFNSDVADVSSMSTDDIKRMMLAHMEAHTYDVTPTAEPDAGT